MRKSDPFSSVRTALATGVAVECLMRMEKPSLYGGRSPYYFWNNQEHPSAFLNHQLTAADALGLLTWELIEDNSLIETERQMEADKQAGNAEGKIYYRWRKRLVSLNAEAQPAQAIERPTLGDHLLVLAKAARVKAWRNDVHGVNRLVVEWHSRPHSAPIEAVFIGYRTLYEGVVERSPGYGSDNPGTFTIARTLEGWLFVDHPRHKEYLVFPHDALMEQAE